MAAFKTHNFLPEIFRTETNKKFLNATLNQLTSEPNFKRVNGYIGRKFAPTYKSSDSYVPEIDSTRQNYQVEPGVIVKNPVTDNIDFYSSYVDLVNKISYYGGNVDNHSRLFSSDTYSYDGKFDFDKFVNFSQYYWLKNGPDPVTVSASGVPLSATYSVKLNSENGGYYFSTNRANTNPELILAYGGVYNFELDGATGPFWIQAEPSTDGYSPRRPNINTRVVYGVQNNGASTGTVTFRVPQPDGQRRYVDMPLIDSIDYVSTLGYSEVQNATVDEIQALGGFDGPVNGNLQGKKIIFANLTKIDDYYWTDSITSEVVSTADRNRVWIINVDGSNVVTLTPYLFVARDEKVYVKAGTTHATKNFYINYLDQYAEAPPITANLTQLYYQSSDSATAVGIISLVAVADEELDPAIDIVGKANFISANGVTFTNGLKVKFDSSATAEYANKTFFVEGVGKSIRLVPFADMLSVEEWSKSEVIFGGTGYEVNDVLTVAGGEYISPAKIMVKAVNTSGSITSFEVIDSGEYTLLPDNPVGVTGGSGNDNASFNLTLQPTTQEYITVNRSSLNKNAWSRYNRWFHIDVIRATADYLDQDFSIDQDLIAKRPIIEFDPDIALFNYGKVALSPINVIDTLVTDAYTQVERQAATNIDSVTLTIDGGELTLHNGDRVIFSQDDTPATRAKIYDFSIVNIGENETAGSLTVGRSYTIYETGSTNWTLIGASENSVGVKFVATGVGSGSGVATVNSYICVIEESGDVVDAYNSCLVMTGSNAGKEYWFNGTNWILSQSKTSANQEPLFDVFDVNDVSFGDTNSYIISDFIGTKLFSYIKGTGINDPVLGFPLSYRTFQNVGDIKFQNNFDNDTFTHLVAPAIETVRLNTGYIHITTGLTTFERSNMWTPVVESSKQYQLISHIADGVNNLFEIDILPNPSTVVPNLKVSLNGHFLSVDDFGLSQVGARYAILINPTLLAEGDNVDILIYSDSVSKLGHYQVPVNLDNNAENSDFTSLTLGQLRNHLVTLSENSLSVTGDVPGNSNIRDLNIKTQGGNILKHSAPAIYSQLFLIDESLNFVNGIRLAQKEYSKFKNKFLEIASQTVIDVNDIAGSVDAIVTQINGIKNINFPWYYSDMVPWSANKVTLPTYTVLDLRIRSYELSQIFDDTVLSNKAVLIYHSRTTDGVTTKQLMVKDRDYTFNTAGPNFIVTDTFGLNYGDQLTVVEYSSTDGNFVPETPTKLGLWPKFVPEKYTDETYTTARDVIQGHDGSITPAFGDYRDDLLIELERRIYNNIKIDFKFDELINYIPGKFRITDYSLKEYNQILSNNFLTWVGNNRLDYTTNSYFKSNDPWTWNYKNFRDTITGDMLPGAWRAVFKWLFDTDRPHTHPWEMLGFTFKPDWWDDRYGTAPYTGGNLNLWSDLSLGFIYDGPRAGIDKRYARPGLLQFIPVDDAGNLRSPEKFAVLDFDSSKGNASYAIGDQGPVETAWRRSSDYPFAVQLAIALMKPAAYFGKTVNVNKYAYNSDLSQYLSTETNSHLTPTSIKVNGDTDSSGNTIREAGYINWISDYLKNLGISSPQTKINDYLNYLTVQLGYKVGGFTDKNFLKILAEQGSPNSQNNGVVIPDENYRIELNKSVPVDKIVYSAVIVERSQNGYTISGYNINNPYFTIVPSAANNNAYSISAGTLTALVYKDYQKIRVKIPYGYEFATHQQVVDFLVGYQRQLQSLGFTFTDYNSELKHKQDWVLSAKEFMTWSQQGWKAGSLIVLSPVNNSLRVSTTNSVVDEITNTPNGSKVMDPNFAVIKSNTFTVVRDDNSFSLTTIKDQTIAYAELNLVQYEHVVIFDNTTVFNDVIYAPETGNRQYRLKIVGYKTADWTGALNPPGFVYNSNVVDLWESGTDYRKGQLVSYKDLYYTAITNISGADTFDPAYWQQIDKTHIKTGLLPNFATNARTFENIYDIDNPPVSENIDFYSSGITGFRERTYLTDLSLDTLTQNKFYQGYIKQKGTKNAIIALASAELANISNEIEVFEEWAVRVGEYGATDSNQYVEVQLDETALVANPAAVQFIEVDETPAAGAIYYRPSDVYKSSKNNVTRMFDIEETSSDKQTLPTAGYVSVDDINKVIFDLANYKTLDADLDVIGTGYTIWTAKDFSGKWNVYRVSETDNLAVSLTYNLDSVGTLAMINPHNLVEGDIIALKNFNSLYNGFYQISSVVDHKRVNIVLISGTEELNQAQVIYGQGYIFKLTSSRISTQKDLQNIIPQAGWEDNDKVWVDNLDDVGNWGVYNKTSPWTYTTKAAIREADYSGNDGLGESVSVSKNGSYLYAGAPRSNSGTGSVGIFYKNSSGTWSKKVTITNSSTGSYSFGSKVLTNDRNLIISDPGSNNGKGCVFVYDTSSDVITLQVLTAPGASANYNFGASVAASEDGEWLYIGEPGRGRVYAYHWTAADYHIQEISSGTTSVTLDTEISDYITRQSDVYVSGANAYIPGVDYTITGTTLTFTSTLTESVVVLFDDYYQLVEQHSGYTIADPVGSGNKFGSSIKTNSTGSLLAIGAKETEVGSATDAGVVHVYEKSSEKFIANGTDNYVTLKGELGSAYTVRLNGALQVETTDYTVSIDGLTVTFVVTPASGDIITVDNNYFIRVQTLNGLISAPNIQVGKEYTIFDIGSGDNETDFTLIGAKENTPGTMFVATGAGTGQGTAVSGHSISQQQLGYDVDIGSNSCSIYASAVGYTKPDYNSGAVYRFVNQGKLYGQITSTKYAPTVTAGHSIKINGIEVTFSGTTLDSVVDAIELAIIPGVTASNVSGYLHIDSSVVSTNNKLDISPGFTGTAIDDLGLEIFVPAQAILHPGVAQAEEFGSAIRVDSATDTVAISSKGGETRQITTFDSGKTSFDEGSVDFYDTIFDSGAIYIFDLLDNPFASVTNQPIMSYVQQLQGPDIRSDFNFGASLDFKNNYIYVGVSRDDGNTPDGLAPGGSVFEFKNTTGTQGWDLIRYNEPRTNVGSVSKMYLYNKKTQRIVSSIDIYDPVKGKILGIAEQDLDFKSEFDPASYNDSAASDNGYINFNSNYYWGPDQVGKTWWDLSQVRFLDYEQGSLVYRNKNWGGVLEGSVFKVYEWVESNYVPSQYVASGGSGVPKYENNESFASRTSVDPATGTIRVQYYYWVSGKTTVDTNLTNRTNSAYTIQQILENPKDQSISFAGLIARNAVGLFNVASYLTGTDVVLHIDHSPVQNTNIIHSEYDLIKEGGSSIIPDRILNKMQDSLAGVDASLLAVPDPRLRESERYGIDIRPRQTMFVDRLAALENFIKFSNSIFVQYPMADRFDLTNLNYGEELPAANTGEWDISVDTYSELLYIDTTSLANNYKVAVLYNENQDGLWTIYKWVKPTDSYTGTGSRTLFKLSALPAGSSDVVVTVNGSTVSSSSYTISARSVRFNTPPANGATISITTTQGWTVERIQSYLTNLYWTKIDWYATDFDYTQKTTYTVDNYVDINTLSLVAGDTVKVFNDGDGRFAYYRVSDNGTVDRVGSENGTIELSSSLYDLVNNGLSFDATNFDSVRFDQNPVSEIRYIFEAIVNDLLISDLQSEFNRLFFSVINYIFSEQVSPDWIFKTSFISVLHKVRDLAQYPSYIKDNQTFYEDYINEVKPYRTKIREYLPKQTGIDYLHTGATDFDLPGYYDTTTGTYRSPDGSYSTDGNLLLTDDYIDWSNNYTYKVVDINVANGGSGYTLVPNVTISGGGGSGAVAQLFVANGSISSAKIITPGAGYVSTPTLTVNGNGTGAVLVPVLKNEHFKSNTANSYNTVRSITTEIKFDRLLNSDSSGKLFRSNLRVWQANTAYTATIHSGVGSGNVWLASGNLVAYNNEIYAPVNANTSNQPTFDGSLYQKLDAGNTLITSDERIIGYYQPGEGMYDANIALLVNGVEYPGVKVVGSAYSAYTSNVNVGANVSFHSSNSSIVSSNIARVNFLSLGYTSNQQLSVFGSAANDSAFRIVSVTDRVMTLSHSTVVNEAAGANITLRYLTDNDLGNYDAAISSTYLDTALGSRPEDINIDGGAYIDTYNSFGPEEMVPGQVFDTLEMRVFTLNATSVNPNNYYIGRVVVQDIGYGYYESNITITATGITGATFIPTLAANGAVMSIAVDNGGTGLVGNVNPVITITGGNLIPATATAYLTQDWYDTIGYRSFYTMNQDVNYYRISAANTTVLTSNLNITDSNIHVANASILPDPSPESVLPGIVFINGEKIHYYLRDVHNNVLGYIRRAVDGTGAPMVHESGTQVSDAGLAQAIPGSPHTHTMLDMTGNSWTTGTGLAASSTTEATFLKASLSYTP